MAPAVRSPWIEPAIITDRARNAAFGLPNPNNSRQPIWIWLSKTLPRGGQYDHLARVPRTGPRQSRSRRPLTARHRCRAAPRRARGMDPTVRNPRIETAIATPWGSRTALFASQDFPWLPHAIRRTKPRRRERNFRMQRPAVKIHTRGRYLRGGPGNVKKSGKNTPRK